MDSLNVKLQSNVAGYKILNHDDLILDIILLSHRTEKHGMNRQNVMETDAAYPSNEEPCAEKVKAFLDK